MIGEGARQVHRTVEVDHDPAVGIGGWDGHRARAGVGGHTGGGIPELDGEPTRAVVALVDGEGVLVAGQPEADPAKARVAVGEPRRRRRRSLLFCERAELVEERCGT